MIPEKEKTNASEPGSHGKLIPGIKENLQSFLKHHDMFYLYLRTIRCMMKEGPKEAKKRYADYININHPRRYRGHILSAGERKKEQKASFAAEVEFSLIVPLYNTPRKYLKAMIRSVLEQTYGKWELCLADGSDSEHANVERYCRRMSRKDARIRYRKLKKNLGISGNSNVGLSMSRGNYIGLLDHDDLLHPSALYEAMRVIDGEGAEFIYTDEAIFRETPKDVSVFQYKPNYSPDLLRSLNYICHFSVFSRELLNRVSDGFRQEYDGAQDYDLILRLTEKARKVVHIPRELYYWRNHEGSMASDVYAKPYALDSAKRAIEAHLERCGLVGEVTQSAVPSTFRIRYHITGTPLISIIIPNRDHTEDLRKCLESIRKKTTWEHWEAVIVENNSKEEKTFRYYQEITEQDSRIRVVEWKGDFNFSSICNYGVTYAEGEYVLLLNNDVEVITPEWLEEMLMFAQRRDVGAVGCLLYYPDNTIQHAGVVIGIGIAAGHAFRGFPRGAEGSTSRLTVAQNVSAVTGACMMIPKRIYAAVSGLDESFRVALNDVDFCLRIREQGYLIVFTPYAELYHYESRSRGLDRTGTNKQRFESEAASFREKWRELLAEGDPYYNVNLTLRREDFSIRDEDEATGK